MSPRSRSRWGRKPRQTPAPCPRPGKLPLSLLCLLALFAALLLAPTPALAADCPPEAGDCLSITNTGNFGGRIDLIIVGDGYTEAERDKFYKDAADAANGLVASEMYGNYKAVFNTWALFTASAQSGADHPSKNLYVDTAYDATYDTAGIDYLLTASVAKIYVDVNKRFPENDVILCLVNSTDYGGSGGGVAVISVDANALEIVRHELGHIIGNLADEYPDPYPGYPEGDPEPNVASAAHLTPLKWQSWVPDGTPIPTPNNVQTSIHDPVGAYEGARYMATGVYRPTPDCIMRALDVTFCQVCTEAMILQFSRLSLLIDEPVPPTLSAIPAVGPTTFTATIPALADLVFSWKIDGAPATGTTGSLLVDPSVLGLGDGTHTVELTVYDATPLVRDDPQGYMKESFMWTINVDSTLPAVSTTSSGVGGSGGSASGGAGGAGGANSQDGDCGCRLAGEASGAPALLWLLGLIPLARRLAGRNRRIAN